MKYIWEEEDIIPGRIVCDELGKHIRMIGFYEDPHFDAPGFDSSRKYHLIDFGTDGMVMGAMTKLEMATTLTKSHKMPINVIAQINDKSGDHLDATLRALAAINFCKTTNGHF